VSATPKGGMKYDGHLAITRAMRNFKAISIVDKAAVFLEMTDVMESEDQIKLKFGRQISQVTPPFLNSPLPSLVGGFVGFSVDMAVVKVGDLLIQYLVGSGEIFNVIALTQVGDPPLEIIKSLFDFSFGFGMAFACEPRIDLKSIQGSSELSIEVIAGKKDHVIVGVIRDRTSVCFHGFSNNTEVMPRGVVWNQSGADDFSGVIIDGQDQGIGSVGGWNPQMG